MKEMFKSTACCQLLCRPPPPAGWGEKLLSASALATETLCTLPAMLSLPAAWTISEGRLSRNVWAQDGEIPVIWKGSFGQDRDLKSFTDIYCQVTPFLHDILLNPHPIFHCSSSTDLLATANAFICTISFENLPWNLFCS